MKIEFIDNVPHIIPETQKEEDQLFDWYEKQGEKRVDSVISFEWLPRASAKSLDENSNCNKPLVSGSYLRGIGHIHDTEMVDFAEKNNKTMDELILDMVDNGWTQGRDVNGEFEYWEG